MLEQSSLPRFRIATLLWLTAWLASAMGAFGAGWGWLFATGVCGLHLAPWKKVTQLPWGIFAFSLVLLIVLILPAVQAPHGHPRAPRFDVHNLSLLYIAMHAYHDQHGAFPPAYTTGEGGTPLHSWRMLLLPYLEYTPIYEEIALDQARDSPANSKVLQSYRIDMFQSSAHAARSALPNETNYTAVVDEAAVLRPSAGVAKEGITDGLDETILFISARGRDIRWYEPRDLDLDEAVGILTTRPGEPEVIDKGFFASTYFRGGLVLFADGSVGSSDALTDRNTARALLTRSGEEEIPRETLEKMRRPLTVLVVHWLRIFSAALFIALSIAPAFRKREGEPASGEA